MGDERKIKHTLIIMNYSMTWRICNIAIINHMTALLYDQELFTPGLFLRRQWWGKHGEMLYINLSMWDPDWDRCSGGSNLIFLPPTAYFAKFLTWEIKQERHSIVTEISVEMWKAKLKGPERQAP